MDELQMDARAGTDSAASLAELGFPVALCDGAGRVLGASPTARELLDELALGDGRLPERLWALLSGLPAGRAAAHPSSRPTGRQMLFRRHRHAEHEWLLLIEVKRAPPVRRASRARGSRLEGLGQVAASLGRELKESLDDVAAVRAGSGLGHATPDRVAEHAVELERVCRDQLGAVRGLLQVIEHGPPAVGCLSLSSCLARVHASLRTALSPGDHRICYQVPPCTDLVHGHRSAVEYILRHLLTNALEAAEGPAAIRVRAMAEASRSRVHVEVRDNGPGVPPGLYPELFTLLQSNKRGHAGIGLAASRALARDLDGQLVHRPVSRGACFVLTLPDGTGLSHV